MGSPRCICVSGVRHAAMAWRKDQRCSHEEPAASTAALVDLKSLRTRV